jgi:hypothetical protein
MSEQQFGLQARGVHPVPLQEFGAALDDFANGHAGSVTNPAHDSKAFRVLFALLKAPAKCQRSRTAGSRSRDGIPE